MLKGSLAQKIHQANTVILDSTIEQLLSQVAQSLCFMHVLCMSFLFFSTVKNYKVGEHNWIFHSVVLGIDST